MRCGVRQTAWCYSTDPLACWCCSWCCSQKSLTFWNCIRLQLYRLQLYPVALFVVSGGSPTPQKALIVSRYIVSGGRKNPPCCNCIQLQLYPLQLYPVAIVSHCIRGGFGTCIRVSCCSCISLRLQLYLVVVVSRASFPWPRANCILCFYKK